MRVTLLLALVWRYEIDGTHQWNIYSIFFVASWKNSLRKAVYAYSCFKIAWHRSFLMSNTHSCLLYMFWEKGNLHRPRENVQKKSPTRPKNQTWDLLWPFCRYFRLSSTLVSILWLLAICLFHKSYTIHNMEESIWHSLKQFTSKPNPPGPVIWSLLWEIKLLQKTTRSSRSEERFITDLDHCYLCLFVQDWNTESFKVTYILIFIPTFGLFQVVQKVQNVVDHNCKFPEVIAYRLFFFRLLGLANNRFTLFVRTY